MLILKKKFFRDLFYAGNLANLPPPPLLRPCVSPAIWHLWEPWPIMTPWSAMHDTSQNLPFWVSCSPSPSYREEPPLPARHVTPHAPYRPYGQLASPGHVTNDVIPRWTKESWRCNKNEFMASSKWPDAQPHLSGVRHEGVFWKTRENFHETIIHIHFCG